MSEEELRELIKSYKPVNPYKEGTLEFLNWQEAYLAGRIDGTREATIMYLNILMQKGEDKK